MSLRQLATKALVEIKKGDTATGNAEQHYLRAGQYLVQANSEAKHGEWLPMLKKIGISKERAAELMRIASGETTVAETRERVRKAMKKSRAKKRKAKSASRDTHLDSHEACDYNPEDPEHVADPGDSMEVIRHRIFLHCAAEVLRYAKENRSDEMADSEIDKEILKATQIAAEAWSNLYQQLLARHTRKKGKIRNVEKEESSARSTLH